MQSRTKLERWNIDLGATGQEQIRSAHGTQRAYAENSTTSSAAAKLKLSEKDKKQSQKLSPLPNMFEMHPAEHIIGDEKSCSTLPYCPISL